MKLGENDLLRWLFSPTFIKEKYSISLQYIHTCAITAQESTLDYLHMVCGQSVALFRGLMGDCEMYDYLTATSTMPTEVTSVSKGDLECPIGFCNFNDDIWKLLY